MIWETMARSPATADEHKLRLKTSLAYDLEIPNWAIHTSKSPEKLSPLQEASTHTKIIAL